MPVPSGSGFSDKKTDAILKRAIDLQAKENASRLAGAPESVSIEHLLRAAGELGVDERFVRQAADELSRRPAAKARGEVTEPKLVERTFPVTVNEADYPELLEHLRATSKTPGSAQVIGATLEWTAFVPFPRNEMIHVVVVPSAESTTVRIRSTNPFARIGTQPRVVIPLAIIFALVVLIIAPLVLQIQSFQWGMLVPVLLIGGVLIGMPRYTFARLRQRDGRLAEELMDSLASWMRRA